MFMSELSQVLHTGLNVNIKTDIYRYKDRDTVVNC